MVKIIIDKFTLAVKDREFCDLPSPVSMLSELMHTGVIPNIYYRGNIVDEADFPKECSFTAKFNVDRAAAAMKYAFLKLEGIYADAEILFNGKSFGTANNPNRIYTFDVGDALKEGENILTVKCKAPLPPRRLLAPSGNEAEGYTLAPYVPDMGIIGECGIIITDNVAINGVGVIEEHKENQSVELTVNVDMIGSSENLRALATITSPSGKLYFGGITGGTGKITIPDAELWWPRGMGLPTLYKLAVTLYIGEELQDIYELKIGLRRVEIIKEGNESRLYINGKRFLPLGGTYVREDAVLPLITRERAERIISLAASANMNTVRILGEGLYPREYLYELCDKYGILVLQDISLGYIKPPVATAFASGLTAELCDIMKRVSYHASVGVLYLAVTKTEGGDAPGSPEALLEFCKTCSNIMAPLKKRYAEDIPFVEYNSYATDNDFISELTCGADIVSLPVKKSISEFMGNGSVNIFEPDFECHSGEGELKKMLYTMAQSLRFPGSTEEIIYASGVCAGYNLLREVAEARLTDSSCGIILRQLNDAWPGSSPSAVDYYGRQKPLYYFARRAFKPIFASGIISGRCASVGVSNTTVKPFSGALSVYLYNRDGECLFEEKKQVRIEPLQSLALKEYDFSPYIKSERNTYLVTELVSDKHTITSSVLFFDELKRFDFGNPNIKVGISGSGYNYEMFLTSSGLAYGACIDFEGIDTDISDNYISLYPGENKKLTIKAHTRTTKEKLLDSLKIFTIYNLGKE